MLGGIITIAGGTIASSGFIIGRRPNAKELIEKLTPYQGSIGIVMLVCGVWELFGALIHLGLLGTSPLIWAFWTASATADPGILALTAA